jgi:hypothetical protein
MSARLTVIAAFACLAACAGPTVRPKVAPPKPNGDALLVLPGFGYGRTDDKAFRSIAGRTAREGVDLYVAPFLTRSGLGTSRAKLERFIREHRLDRYERLHVFAFIAGAWTFNPLIDRHAPANLATVIYDRSPFQERAPKIAAAKLPLLAWARYGSTLFDVARTPYPPLSASGVKVAIVVESMPTAFINKHDEAARQYGPFRFACDSFRQRHDDCLYLPMNHDDLYTRFAEVWPEVLAFMRTGRFSDAANRVPPADNALPRGRRP